LVLLGVLVGILIGILVGVAVELRRALLLLLCQKISAGDKWLKREKVY
jgi:TctA family transporter